MKFFNGLFFFAITTGSVAGFALEVDPITQIPIITCLKEEVITGNHFKKIIDVAPYKKSDWNNQLKMIRRLTEAQAMQYANEHPEVTYFFYVKSGELVLEMEDGNYRIFQQRDAVFFKGEPWWGSVEGQADGYVRVSANE